MHAIWQITDDIAGDGGIHRAGKKPFTNLLLKQHARSDNEQHQYQ